MFESSREKKKADIVDNILKSMRIETSRNIKDREENIKHLFLTQSSLKKNKGESYIIGQKINSATKKFTPKDMELGKFKIYNSSILRIMTKWAEELTEKIFKADDLILKRAYKFKQNNGTFVKLDEDHRYLIYQCANEKIEVITKELENLKK